MRTFKEKACFRLRETKKSGENSSDNKDIIHFRSIQQEKKKEYGLLEWDQCGCKSQLCMQQWRILLSKRNVEMKQSNLGGWVLTKVGCCPLHPSLSDTGNSQLVKSHEFFSLSLARFFFFFLKSKWLISELPPRYYNIRMDWKILKLWKVLEDPLLNLDNVYSFSSHKIHFYHTESTWNQFSTCVFISSGKEKLSIKIHCWRDFWLVIPSQRWCEDFFLKLKCIICIRSHLKT